MAPSLSTKAAGCSASSKFTDTMNATLDQILVAAAFLSALAFFAARLLRRKKNCDAGCGCDVAKKPLVKRH